MANLPILDNLLAADLRFPFRSRGRSECPQEASDGAAGMATTEPDCIRTTANQLLVRLAMEQACSAPSVNTIRELSELSLHLFAFVQSQVNEQLNESSEAPDCGAAFPDEKDTSDR